MTLGDLKKRTLSLVEEIDGNVPELTNDPDIAEKLNYTIDFIQHELCRIKRLYAMDSFDVEKGEQYDLKEELDNFYKGQNIEIKDANGGIVGFDMFGSIIVPEGDGTAEVKYYRYPKAITKDTPDTYKMELDDDVLNIMPYGVAADIFKEDPSRQYGQVYANRYTQLKNELDIAVNSTQYYIGEGV